MPSIMWFRRDLRLSDHPALTEAAAHGEVLPVFVFDPKQLAGNEAVSRTYLYRSVRALNEQLDGRLCVRVGDPLTVIPALAREIEAEAVHISADYGNYGRVRDAAVEQALQVPLVRTGSPYAVAPGRVLKADGTPYRVYTPYYKGWLAHGWRSPATHATTKFIGLNADAIPDDDDLGTLRLPAAGELAALARWQWFREHGLSDYADHRDRADLDGTSQLSAPLRFGEVHPRTLLAGLGDEKGHEVFRKEICWREFYADVLWHNPRTATEYLDERFAGMQYDTGKTAEARFLAPGGRRRPAAVGDARRRRRPARRRPPSTGGMKRTPTNRGPLVDLRQAGTTLLSWPPRSRASSGVSATTRRPPPSSGTRITMTRPSFATSMGPSPVRGFIAAIVLPFVRALERRVHHYSVGPTPP